MITLYHGSYVKIEKPDVKFGRKNLDFGPGFYVTNIHQQASSWAKIIASRKGRLTKPYVSIYKFNVSDAIKECRKRLISVHPKRGYPFTF